MLNLRHIEVQEEEDEQFESYTSFRPAPEPENDHTYEMIDYYIKESVKKAYMELIFWDEYQNDEKIKEAIKSDNEGKSKKHK